MAQVPYFFQQPWLWERSDHLSTSDFIHNVTSFSFGEIGVGLKAPKGSNGLYGTMRRKGYKA